VSTPIKVVLKASSPLHAGVCEGLGALKKSHKKLVDVNVRASFLDSLEIDEGLKRGNEGSHRWDYLLGDGESSLVVGLEPHSAYTGEVSTVIAKKNAAKGQLRDHLKPGGTIAAWFWVASGKVDFAPHDKVIRRLEQEGITFVGGTLRAKELLGVRGQQISRR
jgi:hypothetical protein